MLQRQIDKARSLLCGSSDPVITMTITAAETLLSGAAALLSHFLSMNSLVDTLTGFTSTNACNKSRVGAVNLISFVLPISFLMAPTVKNLPAVQETLVRSLG